MKLAAAFRRRTLRNASGNKTTKTHGSCVVFDTPSMVHSSKKTHLPSGLTEGLGPSIVHQTGGLFFL